MILKAERNLVSIRNRENANISNTSFFKTFYPSLLIESVNYEQLCYMDTNILFTVPQLPLRLND